MATLTKVIINQIIIVAIYPKKVIKCKLGPSTAHTVLRGMDKYVTVTPKRRRSPTNTSVAPNSKVTRNDPISTNNRYEMLSANESETNLPKYRPPPINLREQSSKVLLESINKIIGKDK